MCLLVYLGYIGGHDLLRKFVFRNSFYQCGKSGAQNNILRGMGGRKSVKYQPGWKIRICYVVMLKFINILVTEDINIQSAPEDNCSVSVWYTIHNV